MHVIQLNYLSNHLEVGGVFETILYIDSIISVVTFSVILDCFNISLSIYKNKKEAIFLMITSS